MKPTSGAAGSTTRMFQRDRAADLTDYKQRNNLVLILHHGAACKDSLDFLQTLGEARGELRGD